MDCKQCRTCLRESAQNKFLDDTIFIFDSNIKLSELVMSCASVQIYMEDHLPNSICIMCVECASSAYKFKRKCEESDRELKLVLKPSTYKPTFDGDFTIDESISNTQNLRRNVSLNISATDEDLCENDTFDSDDDKTLMLLRNETEINRSKCHKVTKDPKNVIRRKHCLQCKKEFTNILALRKHILKCKFKSANKFADALSKAEEKRKCHMCNLNFKTLKLLRDHETEHTEIKCLDCGKEFSTFHKLRRHKLRHCKVQFPPQFHCGVCKLPFSSNAQLTEHRLMHNDRTCEYCGKHIMKEYEQKHLQIHEKNGLKCLQCDTTFSTLSVYRQHISTHSTFNCSDCLETFTTNLNFRAHKEQHFFNKTHPENCHECSECDQRFDDRQALFQHFLAHISYTCRVCKGRVKTIHELAEHSCEKELGKMTCGVCGKVFGRVAHHKRHLLTHNASVSACKFCEFKSGRPTDLAKHMMLSHDEMRIVQCPDCDKKFFTEINMQQHRTTHTGQKKHVCDYCGKMFTHSHYLKEHIRIHTGERLHTCTVCQKQFIQYRSLASHMDMHLPRQEHTCSICGKTSPRKSGLRIHMKRHLDERPFNCSVCHKAFKTKPELDKHEKIHTGEKPHECEVCGKGFIQAHSLKGHMKTHHGKDVNE